MGASLSKQLRGVDRLTISIVDSESVASMGDDKDSIKDILRRSLAEFVGTYFLALGVGMSSLAGPMGPYVPGLTLMVVVFCFGHVSMASFNPAVSLAMAIRPYLLSWKAMLFYCLAELVAGLLGGLTAWGFGGNVVPGLGLDDSLAKVFFGEFLARCCWPRRYSTPGRRPTTRAIPSSVWPLAARCWRCCPSPTDPPRPSSPGATSRPPFSRERLPRFCFGSSRPPTTRRAPISCAGRWTT